MYFYNLESTLNVFRRFVEDAAGKQALCGLPLPVGLGLELFLESIMRDLVAEWLLRISAY